jgi:hypothetical protein
MSHSPDANPSAFSDAHDDALLDAIFGVTTQVVEGKSEKMRSTVVMPKKFNRFETMSRANLLVFMQHQAEQIARLKAQKAGLPARVEKREAQLAKNSSTSRQPPSSEGLKKPMPTSRREQGQRKSGGQPGHKGETLARVANPAEGGVDRLTTGSPATATGQER